MLWPQAGDSNSMSGLWRLREWEGPTMKNQVHFFDRSSLSIAVFGLLLWALTAPAEAAGFQWFFKNVRPTGQCGGAREVAVSYYNFVGRRTANGERFSSHAHTAAHRSLAFGTKVHLKNPRNGRTVIIRINDRGPYGPAHRLGVKFDLGYGAARALGLLQTNWVCVIG
jgi:rare lipoprotein A (peptidoglycan hydrolase)